MKINNYLRGNLPPILFRPKPDTKEYFILLFWSTKMNDSECEIQKKLKIVKPEIAIDHSQLFQTSDGSCTKAKTCKHALICIILLIKDRGTINDVITYE